jgi:hypothetical protein
VYNLLGKHILLYDADDFTLHYQLGHVTPDTLVPLPVLAGYPLVPDVERAMEDIRQHLRANSVTPEEVARQCAAAEFPGYISMQLLRRFLIDTPRSSLLFVRLSVQFHLTHPHSRIFVCV